MWVTDDRQCRLANGIAEHEDQWEQVARHAECRYTVLSLSRDEHISLQLQASQAA